MLGDSFADMVAGGAAMPVTPSMAPKAVARPVAPLAVASLAVAPVVPVAQPVRQPDPAQKVTPDAIAETAVKPLQRKALSPVPEPVDIRPVPRPERATPAASPRAEPAGTADQNRKKGVATGNKAGISGAAKAAASASKGDGGKAAAAYGSKVLRKISRTRKAKAPTKGRAIVGFAIAANGGLHSVRIVTSSGHSGLDKVALDHIRRAAPFPAPPPGAQREFAFEFLGRR